MSILNNKIRNGSVTSSGVVALIETGSRPMNDAELSEAKACGNKRKTIDAGFSAAGMTYITECNYERILDDTIDSEFDAKPTSWGLLCETKVFAEIGIDYVHCSDVTTMHPTIDYWCGSCDGFKEVEERTVFDFKAPFTKKSFIGLILPLVCGLTGMEAMKAVREGFTHDGKAFPKHKDGDKFYWQLVSNAIINKCDWAELIVYMPYQSELIDIANIAGDNPQYSFLKYADVPYLKDDGQLKNINIIRFKIPQEDKDFLTSRVIEAGAMLIPRITTN